ncbi:uncharacterized protein [Malus domestica]|uniref:uncharacterized protein isoform X1 n=1 Tax=Malus domestica TaxID=3750 RepID=UPI0007EDDD1F
MMRRQQEQDQQSRVFYELSALVLNLLRSPPTPIQFSDNSTVMPPSSSSSSLRRPPAASTAQISPAGFASLMLGISMALMLCGSVTFFIGFLLMPWVLGLVMVLYVAGILWSLSVLGKSILCYASAPSTPRKDIPELYKQLEINLKPFALLERGAMCCICISIWLSLGPPSVRQIPL